MAMDVQWAIFWAEVALSVITLLAVGIALFGENIRKRANKPIIKIRFRNDLPYVLALYAQGSMKMLFRLRIINQGKTVAKNCRVKIISVIPEGGSAKDCLISEPDILKWSGAPKDTRYQTQGIYGLAPIYRENKDITPKGGWEFCDLFEIGTREKRIVFVSSGERNFLAEDDNYIATIEISGDNLEPVRREIKFFVPHKVDPETYAFHLAGIKEITPA